MAYGKVINRINITFEEYCMTNDAPSFIIFVYL